MRNVWFILISSCLLSFNALAYPITPMTIPLHNTLFSNTCCLVVAHAGGGLNGHVYANSTDALTANYALGRRVFELDFDKTKDGVWVLTHGWRDWAKDSQWEQKRTWFETAQDTLQGKPFIPTEAQFKAMPLYGFIKPTTLTDLVVWLITHPDATILTDSKKDFSALFAALTTYPEISSQIIFQVSSKAELEFLKQRNVLLQRVIFTNYKENLSTNELIALFQSEPLGALTLPLPQALAWTKQLSARLPHTPIYVHGQASAINSMQVQLRLKDAGVAGFYLD